MKRFVDYSPTKEEMDYVFGEGLDAITEFFDEKSCGDDEKLYIAQLLFYRGQKEESRKIIDSVEDKRFRRHCMEMYGCWCDWEKGYL